jgi:UDPglucose 6-dehydrogenase
MGLGFVGLTTALGFCEHGHTVFGCDIDQNKMETLRKGDISFYEPELEDNLRRHLADGRFHLVDEINEAIAASSYVFICVGTPSGKTGEVNLDFLESAVISVLAAQEHQSFLTLVIKSTVPPSTTRDFIRPLIESKGLQIGKDIGVAVNPEFLCEGYAWRDFLYPDRIVIGREDERSAQMLAELYRDFKAPIFIVSSATAEFIKYLSNTLLATMISFANEQSLLAKRIRGIDVKQAFHILHQDKRWSGSPANMASYVYPGCGFGGYCLPKDTQALVSLMRDLNYHPSLLSSVLEVNATVKRSVVDEIIASVGTESTIGVLGLAFKPNSDDVRESPAKDIIAMLLARGYTKLIAYDPLAMQSFQEAYGFPIQYAESLNSCVERSSLLVLLTAWSTFVENKELIVNKKCVLDYRYVL